MKSFLNLLTYKNIKFNLGLKLKLKKVYSLVFVALVSLSLSALADSDDVRRLEENIVSLKSKIRASNAKDPKDIQKLYKLENELEKKLYLQKNKSK